MFGVICWTLVASGVIRQPMSLPAEPTQAFRVLHCAQVASAGDAESVSGSRMLLLLDRCEQEQVQPSRECFPCARDPQALRARLGHADGGQRSELRHGAAASSLLTWGGSEGCLPQTGMVKPVLLQLPEMSSTSSTSSLMTALPMACRPPKVIMVLVLLMALRDDAAPGT